MRYLMLIVAVAVAAGCGDSGGTAKPANPAPKFDLDAKAQKKAGDYAPP